ncbi:MAG: hypothetical protein ACOYOP_11750 [Microthrixaceae bacterium]
MSIGSRERDERGFVAGGDTILIGTVVVVVLVLVLVRAWGVADRRAHLEQAAGEYLRTYTEARDPLGAARDAEAAARLALGPQLSGSTTVTGPDPAAFGPCEPARVTLRTVVPALPLPGGASFGRVELEVTRTELVDAHRAMSVGSGHRWEDTPCAD